MSNENNSDLIMKSNIFSLHKWIFIISFFFFAAIPFLCQAFSPEDEASRIQKAYEGFKDISGNFIQKSYIKDLKRTDTYKGRFYIKASKFRWEYTGDKPQTIYISGDKLIIYQKNEKQAYITKFDRSTYGQSPIILLGGLGDIRKDFDISSKDGRLILNPKSQMGNISQIEVATLEDEFPIKSLIIVDLHSNRTQIEFRDIKVNTGLKDRLFEFSPTEGVTIIRQ
jgi:outer membrane lipoprotein carrier protein